MRSITKTFPGVKALSDVTLEVARGEIHAICGENGAGKSTLMKVLSGVYPHGTYEGDIVFEDEDGGSSATSATARPRASSSSTRSWRSAPTSRSPRTSSSTTRSRAASASSTGTRPTSRRRSCSPASACARTRRRRSTSIGVGKQQLVEIAKALSKRVKLLILDEPTAALNDEDSDHLLDLILHLKEQGITSIIISHKLNEIKKIADTVTVIRDGKTIETIAKSDVTEDRIIKDMVGRDLEHRYPDHTPHIGEEMLRVEDWTAHHPQDPTRVMVDNVNLNVRAGEIVGIAGLMGAGRTEFAMSLFGHSYGTRISGKVFKRGKEIKTRTVAEAIDNGLAYATEDRKTYGLNLIEDIKRNISMASLDKLAKRGLVNDNEEYKVANEYRTRHEHQGADRAREDRQALGRQPAEGRAVEVDLLRPGRADPRRADPRHRRRRQVRDLHDHQPARGVEGKGIIVISSELPELLGICDRVYALSEGRITGELPIDEATPEAVLKLMTMEKPR